MNPILIPSDLRYRYFCNSWKMIILAAVLQSTACDRNAKLLVMSGATMGTSYSIKTVREGHAQSTLQAKIDAELQRLNAIFSTYDKTSELSRFNRSPVSEPVPVSSDLMAVLRISAAVHQLSEGAFDVTLAPLINLWGFGPGERSRDDLPAEGDIKKLLHSIGFDGISLGLDTATRQKLVTLDLSAVAKGYAVDRIAELLEAEGIANYLVEIGGELRGRGTNSRGEDWLVAIEKPLAPAFYESPNEPLHPEVYMTLPIHRLGMATSGNYRNFFDLDGVRYSHTIDPTTGWPVNHNLVSVTVLHESTAWADALATAFTVLGVEQSLELATAHHWMFLAIVRDASPEDTAGQDIWMTITSPAMDDYLEAI